MIASGPRIPRLQVTVLIAASMVLCSIVGCDESADSIDAILAKATVLNDRERFDEALAFLDDEIGKDSGTADAFYLRGVARENLQQLELAVDAYSECLKLDPGNSDALNNRGVIHGRLGNLDQAIADLKQAVEFNPDDALAWSNLGLAYHEIGNFDEALQSYNEAALRSKDPRIFYQRGNTQLAARRYQDAIEDFSSAIKSDSMYARAYLNRGIAHFRLGDLESAAKDLDLAEKYDGDMTVTPLVQNLRDVLDQRSLRDKAVSAVRKWIEHSGWEAAEDGEHPFDFVATRLPAPVDSESDSQNSGVPDNFRAVVLVYEPDVGVVSQFETISAAIKVANTEPVAAEPDKTTNQLCLFVVDATELKSQNVDRATGQPFWLLHANYDWHPDRNDFQPYQVLMKLPSVEDRTSHNQADHNHSASAGR